MRTPAGISPTGANLGLPALIRQPRESGPPRKSKFQEYQSQKPESTALEHSIAQARIVTPLYTRSHQLQERYPNCALEVHFFQRHARRSHPAEGFSGRPGDPAAPADRLMRSQSLTRFGSAPARRRFDPERRPRSPPRGFGHRARQYVLCRGDGPPPGSLYRAATVAADA